MLRSVALVRRNFSEELSASFIRVKAIDEQGITLAYLALHSSEISFLIRATRLNIPEVAILHSHRRENLKSYMASDKIYLAKIRAHWEFSLISLTQ
jgi:hypothetical protein